MWKTDVINASHLSLSVTFLCDFGVLLIWAEYISSSCDPLLSTGWSRNAGATVQSPCLRSPSVSVSSLVSYTSPWRHTGEWQIRAKLNLPGGPKWGPPRSPGSQVIPDMAATPGKLTGNACPKAVCQQALGKMCGGLHTASLVAQMVKCLPAMRATRVRSLGREDPLEKEMATHSSTLAWKIPWREEPCRLQSMGSQRVGHDSATSLHFTLLWQ